ncbi:MAG: helix-turn-helix domain-containing protein [Pseudobdellovibrionaceae bacterium]
MSSIEAKYNKLLRTIGANLKRMRKSRNLSQADMTGHGFELRNYQRLESGRHSPSLFTLHRLATIFDCEVKDLFS